MKIGLFTAGYRRSPLRHAFEDAARFGYDYIELLGERPHAYPPDLDRERLGELRALIADSGVPVLGFTPSLNSYPHNFMLGTEKMRRDAVDHIKRSIDCALELGAQFTLLSPGHAGYETTYDALWRRLTVSVREIADYAERCGHRVIIEPLTPMESNVITTANELCRLLDEVPSPALYGMCDLVPPFVGRESILSYFTKLGPRLKHLHIVDSDGASESHILPGEGKLPLRELLREIADTGYDETATIELVTNYISEPRLYARRAIENLRAMMA